MKKKIRNFILQNPFLRELFFFIKGKKVNRKNVDKKIRKLTICSDEGPVLNDVIISLTTYGDRLYELQYTLYSLITQTVRPEKIIVNLAKKDYGNIPDGLRVFEKFNISFVETEDFRSYKKLIPTLVSYPSKYIVTADDDIYYRRDWLEALWNSHLKNPDCIVCHITTKIGCRNDLLLPYSQWRYNKGETEPLYDNLILGAGGTLFPPEKLYSDITKSELFMELAPFADDIWFYFMAILYGTRIKQLPKSYMNVKYVNPYREYEIDKGETLAQLNVSQGKNDLQLFRILDYYGIKENDFVAFLKNEKELNFNGGKK